MKTGEVRAHIYPPGMYLVLCPVPDGHGYTAYRALVLEGHEMAMGLEQLGDVNLYSQAWLSMFTELVE